VKLTLIAALLINFHTVLQRLFIVGAKLSNLLACGQEKHPDA
jgi:hypothetical protein